MATHEENMKDPEWLSMQMDRYKAEASAVVRERDALAAQVKALEVQLADLQGKVEATRAVVTAKGSEVRRLQEAHSKMSDEAEEVVGRLTAERDQALEGAHQLKGQLDESKALAAARRAALGQVVQVAGKVLEVAAPLLDE